MRRVGVRVRVAEGGEQGVLGRPLHQEGCGDEDVCGKGKGGRVCGVQRRDGVQEKQRKYSAGHHLPGEAE